MTFTLVLFHSAILLQIPDQFWSQTQTLSLDLFVSQLDEKLGHKDGKDFMRLPAKPVLLHMKNNIENTYSDVPPGCLHSQILQLSHYLWGCRASLGGQKDALLLNASSKCHKFWRALEGQDSWKWSRKGNWYLIECLLRLLWGGEKRKLVQLCQEEVHMCQGWKIAGKRTARIKFVGKTSSRAGGKREDDMVREEKNNLYGFYFWVIVLEWEPQDILNTLFWIYL